MKVKKRNRSIPAPTERALELLIQPSQTDVDGSYTGKPIHKKDKPVQDADDL